MYLVSLFVMILSPFIMSLALLFFLARFKMRDMELQLKMRELNVRPSDLGWPEKPVRVWTPRRVLFFVVVIALVLIAQWAISRYFEPHQIVRPKAIRPHRERVVAQPARQLRLDPGVP